MASKLFDTSKIVSNIKAGKITSKEPPKYIFERNNRGRKVRKLNPRWTAWNKNKNKRKIDKDVDKYVKDRKGPINKDLTIDNSKKKKVVKKTNNTQQTNTSKTETPKTETPKTETPKTEVKKVKKKTTREKFNEKFIRTKKGTLARRGTVGARHAENLEAARKRAQAAAKLRIKKKKEKKS